MPTSTRASSSRAAAQAQSTSRTSRIPRSVHATQPSLATTSSVPKTPANPTGSHRESSSLSSLTELSDDTPETKRWPNREYDLRPNRNSIDLQLREEEDFDEEDSDEEDSEEVEQDALTPLEFAPPDRAKIKTLDDLLRVSLPPLPSVYKEKALQSTKNVTAKNVDLPVVKQLAKVVHLPRLVEQLRDTATPVLRKTPIDWNNEKHAELAYAIHPHVTARPLAQVIRSEKDVEILAHSLILHPALLAIRATMYGIQHSSDIKIPYISSAAAGAVIPDALLVSGPSLDKPVYPLTMEVKTPPAMMVKKTEDSVFRQVTERWCDERLDIPEGTAMRFNWPTDLANCNKQTRILVQVWSEMVDYNCDMGVLTSVDRTIFLARGHGEDDDTLYLSSVVRWRDFPIRDMYCWLAHALGISKTDLKLPPANSTWWPKESRLVYAHGLVASTLYHMYPQKTRKRGAAAIASSSTLKAVTRSQTYAQALKGDSELEQDPGGSGATVDETSRTKRNRTPSPDSGKPANKSKGKQVAEPEEDNEETPKASKIQPRDVHGWKGKGRQV